MFFALKGHALAKHIPVIVLSGLVQANEAKLLKEGAAAFLVKSEKLLENDSALLISGRRKSSKRKQNASVKDQVLVGMLRRL
jgi:hypothetical protein